MNAMRILKLAVILGAIGAITPAFAVTSTNHAAAFHAFDFGQAADIDYTPNAVRNMAGSTRYVIAPLVRVPTTDGSLKVNVAGTHSGTQTTSCTLYSVSSTGSLLGSKGLTMTTSGAWTATMTIAAGLAPETASAALVCSLGPGTVTALFGVNVVP